MGRKTIKDRALRMEKQVSSATLRRYAIILAFACATLPAFAKDKEWIKVSTSHFEMYTTNGEKKARESILYFEQVRDLFERVRGSKGVSKGKIRLLAFSNEKEYAPYRKNERTQAFYLAGPDQDIIVMGALRDEYYPTVVHEYTHLWLNQSGAKIPIWMNEGLAEVHSTMKPAGNKLALGHPITGRLYEAQNSPWIPLERLIAVDHNSPEYNEGARAGSFYAESWLLMHMLYLGQGFREHFPVFLQNLDATGSVNKSLEMSYGRTLAELDKELKAYARSDRMSYVVFDTKVEKTTVPVEVASATELESGIVQAQTLALMGRSEQADAIYNELAKTHADSAELEQARAMSSWQNRNLESAKQHFNRAMDLKATNAEMYLTFGQVLFNDDIAKSTAALRRAAELAPTNQKAQLWLGHALYHQHDFKGAVAAFTSVKSLKREEAVDYYVALAHADFETGDKAKALANAQAALKYAQSEVEKDRAARINDYLKRAGEAHAQIAVLQTPVTEDFRPRIPQPTTSSPTDASKQGMKVLTEGSESAEGIFVNFECVGEKAKLHLKSNGRTLVFLIDDPRMVVIQQASGAETTSLTCGVQKGNKIRVQYRPDESLDKNLTGVLRLIEFY